MGNRSPLSITLGDVPEGGVDLHVDTSNGPFRHALTTLCEGTDTTSSGSVKVHVDVYDKRVDLDGHIEASISQQCSRCAETFAQDLDRSFRQILNRKPAEWNDEDDEPALEMELSRQDLDRSELTGDVLNLMDVLGEELELAIPVKPLCKDDCKGICSRCGAALNVEECHCEPETDVRWAALKGLRIDE